MPDDREMVCGEGLARELLAAALHCPPEEAPLRYDAQGKPLTDDLYLSISHSRGLAACAVADRPVGLDVELVRPAGAAAGAGVLPDAGGLRPAGLCFFPGAAAGGLDRHPVSGGKTDIGPARCSIGWFRGGTA